MDAERAEAAAEGRAAFEYMGTIFATDRKTLWPGRGEFKPVPGEGLDAPGGAPRLHRVFAQVSELTIGDRIGTRVLAELAFDDSGVLVVRPSTGFWNLRADVKYDDLRDCWADAFEDLVGSLRSLGVPEGEIAEWEAAISSGRVEVVEDDPHRLQRV